MKFEAKKVYGAHCPTQNVTIVQPRLFSAAPSLLNNHAAELASMISLAYNQKLHLDSTSRKRPTGDSRSLFLNSLFILKFPVYQPTASKKVDLSGYGYV